MSNNRIYIAGKITGDPDYRRKFRKAVKLVTTLLEWDADDVVNPVERCRQDWPWWRCMALCLKLVAGCGWVAMLPDWKQSRGARIEHLWAKILGKKIIYLH